MALVTSAVFFTQLLCLLVPCDPQYKPVDTRPSIISTDDELSDSSDDGVGGAGQQHHHLNPPQYRPVDSLHLHSFHVPAAVEPEDSGVRAPLELESSKFGLDIPYVTTSTGVVEGYYQRVVGGRKIRVFEGIPYAEPPVGHLRFRPPVAKSPWKGILKATQYAPPCMQYNVPEGFRTLGQEDCLYLNVYTPQIPDSREEVALPVIVFIHGGGYFFGSPVTYGASYLLQKDVILVTMQYRLGVLGFLSTGDQVCPGNQGLKDQGLALRWVHENIVAFGGDPTRVTLMGQSAGSASVHHHMLSKSSRPYFSGAISLSGSTFNYWSFYDRQQTRNLTNALAKTVGCPTEDSLKLMECLSEKNPVHLVAQTPKFLDDWPYPANAFKPCIEVIDGNPSPFLTDFPANIYQRNEVANVPWITTLRNWYKLAIDLIDAETLDIDRDQVVKRLTRFYFRNTPPEKTPIRTFAQIVTDRMFVTGVYEAAKAHVQVAPTYSYLFDFNGQYNQIENYGYPASDWGVGHGEDLFYVLNGSRVYNGFQRDDPEYIISGILVNLFVNFAAKRVPLYTESDGRDVEIWKPHQDQNNLNFLGISSFIGMVGDPFKRRMKFWRSLRLPDAPANVIVSG